MMHFVTKRGHTYLSKQFELCQIYSIKYIYIHVANTQAIRTNVYSSIHLLITSKPSRFSWLQLLNSQETDMLLQVLEYLAVQTYQERIFGFCLLRHLGSCNAQSHPPLLNR